MASNMLGRICDKGNRQNKVCVFSFQTIKQSYYNAASQEGCRCSSEQAKTVKGKE
jgi:hypothetical protein